jgi:chitin disaccharide deacetylase
MKRLIVNADDLGADDSRNAGIFEAIEAGVVTSVSVLANGPALPDAIHHLRLSSRKDVSIGVHLNLSEGRPLTGDLKYLVGKDGGFLGKARAHQLFQMRADTALQEEIYREAAAQTEALLQAGCPITHLDGHQHVHIFPAVIGTAVRVAEAYGIPWMRIPAESSKMADDAEADMFAALATSARSYVAAAKVGMPDHFRGLYLKGRLTPALLRDTLARLPDGLTELMAHPGKALVAKQEGPFSNFSTRDRETELLILLGEDFRNTLLRHGISLTPFPEVQA